MSIQEHRLWNMVFLVVGILGVLRLENVIHAFHMTVCQERLERSRNADLPPKGQDPK